MITPRFGILFTILTLYALVASSQTVYVSPSGNDANPGTQALPKATVQAGINSSSVGGTVKVLPGTYSGTLTLNGRSITLEGAANIGDVKPVLTQTSGGLNQTLISVDGSTGLTIRGFRLDIDQSFLLNGITTIGNCNNLRLADLQLSIIGSQSGVKSGSATNPTHGILVDGSNVPNFPSVILTNINIEPTVGTSSDNTWYSDRGILLRGVQGTIGGSSTAACNLKAARDILLQFVGGGAINIQSNNLTGGGLDVTLPNASATVNITDNIFTPDSRGAFLISDVLLLKHNANRSRINVNNNQIRGFSNVGLRAAGVANAFVTNNTFTPNDTTTKEYRCIEVNTLWEGTTQLPNITNSITITGNSIQAASGRRRGIGIFLKNERRGASTPDFDFVVIGGAGALANQFSENLNKFIRLDNALLRNFSDNIDGSQNRYTVSGVSRLPSEMSQPELFILEDKIDHAIDDNTLGLVRVRPRATYVTPKSFYRPNTFEADLQRPVDISASGDTVHILDSIYGLPVTINKDLTFKPSGNNTQIQDVVMSSPSALDELRIEKTISIARDLVLTQGRIRIQTNNLRILNPTSSTPPIGTANSYVIADQTGKLVLLNVGSTERNFPIGTASAYRPVVIANQGTTDSISLRIRPQVLSQAITGTPVDTVVDFTWFFSEGTPGGGNYSFRPQWTGTDERANFFRDRAFLQRFRNTRWEFLTGPPPNYLPITGADPYQATASGLTQSFDPETPLRIFAPIEIPDTVYYVDGVDGIDNFPIRSGRTAEFAWKSINYAIANAGRVAPSGFIFIQIKSVIPPYDGAITIPSEKGRIVLRGGYQAIDPSPIIANTLSANPVLTISADSVFLNDLSFQIGLSGARTGILGSTKYNQLNMDSCQVRNIAGATLGTGINLLPATSPQTISLTASQFFGDQPTGQLLQTAFSAENINGVIGGNGTRANRFAGDRSLEITNTNGGNLSIRGNTMVGRQAGVVLAGGNSSASITRNTIAGVSGAVGLGIQAFSFTDAGTTISTDSNTITADTCLHLVNNRNASANSNTLTSESVGIHINSGIAGTLFPTYVTNSVSLNGNTLSATGTPQVAILLGNEAKAQINPAFSQVNIGSTSPNTLPLNFTKFIELQSAVGKEFDLDVDARNNLFGTAGGLKTPASMSQAELFLTENKITHKIDLVSLGLVRLRNNELYVTPQSFIAPRTLSPSIQRGVTPSADGDAIFIQEGDYPDTSIVDKSLRFVATGINTRHRRLEMNGAARLLTLEGDLTLYEGLNLADGKIKLTSNSLTLSSTCPPPTGGSANSYVWTDGTGGLRQNGVGPGGKADSVFYPIGRQSTYNPIFITNSGTSDDIRVRMLDDVFDQGLSGFPVQDSVVKASWVITEGIPGGSELVVRPFWSAAQEKSAFVRERTGIQGYFGTWVPDLVLPLPVAGSDPFSARRLLTGRSFNETPIRVISLPPLKDEVFIPTLFTPNKDGRNDTLLVYSNTVASINLRIYNRYGNIVFETSDVDVALRKGWDGTKDGKELNADTYVWTISGKYKNGKSIDVLGKKTGYIILSR